MHLSSAAGTLPRPMPGTQQTACVTGQFDGEGGIDFIIAERTASPSLVLYRYRQSRWLRSVVEPARLRLEAGGTCFDIDGDGDLDLVLGEDASGDRLFWWENPGPEAIERPWKRRLIKGGGGRKHHDQAAGDFDGDGRPELAFWNQRARMLCVAEVPENVREANGWPYRVIYRWDRGTREHEGLVAADVDRDGRVDLVGAGLWFRSKGPEGFEIHDVLPAARFTRAAAGDLVAGGYLELLFVPGDADGPLWLCRYENGTWRAETIERHVTHGHTLAVSDLNGDGALDIFVAEMGRWGRDRSNPRARMLLFMGDGSGRFVRHVLAVGLGNHESRVADVNGDGRPDLIGKPYNWRTPRIDLWLNLVP